MPVVLHQVWSWFIDLDSQRTSNGFSANSISNSELFFYFYFEDIKPESWEIDLIRKFDKLALNFYSSKTSNKNKNKSDK